LNRYAPGKNLNVTEYSLYLGKHNISEMVPVLGPYEALPYYIHTYSVYLLYYGACFWVFVHDGMTLRIQRCHRLCSVFPESRHWDVRHLVVHSSSPQSEVHENRSLSNH
jgi:hypothetical protein